MSLKEQYDGEIGDNVFYFLGALAGYFGLRFATVFLSDKRDIAQKELNPACPWRKIVGMTFF